MFASDLLDMMVQTIKIKPFLSRTDENVPSYGTEASFRCRLNNKNQNIVNAAGQTVVARGVVWIATITPISTNDLVTLPDGSNPTILAVNAVNDETDESAYTALYFS